VKERVPRLFVTALADLTRWLETAGVAAMIVGGIAASILGRPRATRDIDALAVARDDQWSQLLGSSEAHGIVPRIENPLEFARRTRVLLLRHTESAIDIDIILSGLPFEAEAVSRATAHDLSGVRVRLPQVEDLLIMKAIAHRPQDLRDIEGLLDVFPTANVESVRRRLRNFAAAAELPDLPEEFEKLLAQRKPRSPSASDTAKTASKSAHKKKKKGSKR
jgi:predicted nucleotidyltransferase